VQSTDRQTDRWTDREEGDKDGEKERDEETDRCRETDRDRWAVWCALKLRCVMLCGEIESRVGEEGISEL
jgi:hypothetical protein